MGLYSFVFASRISLITVVLLFVSFMIQPVHLALANVAAAEEAEPEPPSLADVQFEEVPEEGGAEPEPTSDTVEDSPAAESEVVPDEEVTVSDSEDESASNEDEEIAADTEEVNDTVTTVETSESASTTERGNEESTISATTTDESNDEPSTAATSTEPTDVPSDNSTSTIGIDEDTSTSTDGSSDDTSASSGGSGGGSSDSLDDASEETSSSTADTADDSTSDTGGTDSDTTATSTSESEETPTDVVDDQDTTSDATTDEPQVLPTSSTTATSTQQQISTSTELDNVIIKAEALVTDDNYFQFSKQACVSAGGGTYYCSVSEGNVVDSNAVVYSEIGPSGSPEIFIKTSSGEVKQITDNNFEDSSPHYDAVSQKIAWQRLIQGRYQIIIYDIETAEEKQLTFSRTNNMEPSVSVSGVVWQAWDNNDWEVMYYDGTYSEQLTNNDTQDVAPVMQDEYIIWTVIGNSEQFAQVYSLETKETVTISNREGGSILNPRFVLVYDTQFDNGDVITQRFDPETGFAEPIAAQPAEAPLEIPEPDTAGEVKALITTKSTSKQSLVVHGDNPDGTGSGTSTTTSSGTLVLNDAASEQLDEVVSTSTDGTIDAEPEEVIEPFVLTEYDLILPPTPSTTTPVQVSTTTEAEG